MLERSLTGTRQKQIDTTVIIINIKLLFAQNDPFFVCETTLGSQQIFKIHISRTSQWNEY